MIYTADEHSEPILLYEEAVMFKGLYCGGHLGPFVLGCVLACTLGSVCAQAADVSHHLTFVNNTDDRWLLLEAKGSKRKGVQVPPKKEQRYDFTTGKKLYYICAFDKETSKLPAGSCQKESKKSKQPGRFYLGSFRSPTEMEKGDLSWTQVKDSAYCTTISSDAISSDGDNKYRYSGDPKQESSFKWKQKQKKRANVTFRFDKNKG